MSGLGSLRRPGGSAVFVAVCCAVLTACSAAAEPAAPGSQPTAQGTAAPGAGHGAAHGALSGTPGESPGDTALRLEALLGQHAVLAADLMRGRIRNDEDFGQAANAAVGRNTEDLAGVVGGLFGEQAASRFRTLWADHVTALFNYSRALATDDAAARDDARTKLVAFETELADFFSSAAQGRLPQESARGAVTSHVEHLLGQADAYAARDWARSDALYRQGYNHSFEIGNTLASTLLPPDQAAGLQEPSWRLRSALDRLLGEHVALAVAALRAGATNSPGFPSAANALNGNTQDLGAAIGTLFGEPAGQRFTSMWADHIDQLVSYAAGVAAADAARRDAARSRLRAFEGEMAAFLESATGNKVSATDLAKAYLAHDEMLTQQVDAFVGKDYPRAHELGFATYQDMFGLSRQLSDAFGETVAARLPRGGAATGAGGVAGASGAGAPAAGSSGVGSSGVGAPAAGSFRSVRRYAEVAEPVRLRIPAAAVDTRLQRLGRAPDGSVEVPVDFGAAGWFAEGPRPGQSGPAVILGHLDSRTGPAVFVRLPELAPGAAVVVDRADGSSARFRVSRTLQVPKAAFPTDLVYGATLEPSLRLVTCGGSFDQGTGSYRDNVIVYAEPTG